MVMRLAFDHQAFVMQSYGGVSRYYTQLVPELKKAGSEPHIFAPLHKNVHLSELSDNLVSGRYFKKFPAKTASLVNRYNRYKLDGSILQFTPDILHETYYWPSIEKKTKFPIVLTVYDMIHELFPAAFPAHDLTAKYKYEAVMRADHIICISENTKKDLIELYNIPLNKTSVVHLASDIKFPQKNQSRLSLDKKPFILFVGQRAGYKNFDKFISSIALSYKLNSSVDIICFGGGSFSHDENKRVSELGFRDNQVKHVSGNDEFLSQLYSRARAFVYPSQYEGFGLPVLEAMSRGCPVICSNLSSLPEVGGCAARYFNPNNIEEMSNIIETVIFSDSDIDELTSAGKKRASEFSWKNSAKKTLSIYSKIR
jgi:glycosyltransferase involved in cell wall biosynthesis